MNIGYIAKLCKASCSRIKGYVSILQGHISASRIPEEVDSLGATAESGVHQNPGPYKCRNNGVKKLITHFNQTWTNWKYLELEVLSVCHYGEIKLPYLLASRTNISIKGHRNLEGYGRQVQWSFQII